MHKTYLAKSNRRPHIHQNLPTGQAGTRRQPACDERRRLAINVHRRLPRCTTSRNLCRFRMHIAALSACSCHVSIFVTTLSARHSERVRLKQRLARSLRSQRLDTNADSKAPTHDMTHRPHARRGDGDACEYGGDGDPHEQATGAMSRFEISKAKQTNNETLTIFEGSTFDRRDAISSRQRLCKRTTACSSWKRARTESSSAGPACCNTECPATRCRRQSHRDP